MSRALLLLILGAGAWYAWRRGYLDKLLPIGSAHAASLTSSGARLGIDFGLPTMTSATAAPKTAYVAPAAALPYLAAIRQAESANGLPANLLLRLLDQESKFRPDIISGKVSSRAGALGIAQVMPATAASPGYGVPPLANPLDPFQAIAWAARYLRAMYARFGDWRLALAAYNYGPGAVAAGKPWPQETVAYVYNITRDVTVA